MTAGIYASRLGMKVLVITKSFGGQIAKKTVSIENYPGFLSVEGPELVKKMEEHLKKNKVEIKMDQVLAIKKQGKNFLVNCKNKGDFEAKALVLATGSDPRPLEVPGEKEFIGKGVSYCSLCDGPIFKDKVVAIIGGGNAGFETAIFLSNIAKKIYILEAGPESKAFMENQKVVEKSKKIELITSARLKEIRGQKLVDSIVYTDKNKKEITLNVSGVFVEVGYEPATSYAKGFVDFNERDEIKVASETCQTSTPGIFAAGDLNEGQYKQIVTAAGEGAKAALAAYGYVKHKKMEK